MSSPPVLTDPLVVRAAAWAADLFAAVTRKAGGAPYFDHLAAVAAISAEYTADPEVIAAAYLHDAIEDDLTTAADLAARFGPRVLALTLAVTEQKHGGTWEERKAAYVAQLDSVGSAIIAGADKVDNLTGLLAVTDWRVFNAPPHAKLAHYRHVGEAVRRHVPALGDRVLALCDQLAAKLTPLA